MKYNLINARIDTSDVKRIILSFAGNQPKTSDIITFDKYLGYNLYVESQEYGSTICRRLDNGNVTELDIRFLLPGIEWTTLNSAVNEYSEK